MSQPQTLRDLVNERLSAAAEEIFALFVRTIAEYEEQLRLYKQENQRKQGLLDSALAALGGPQVHGSIKISAHPPTNPPLCPGPGQNPQIQESPAQMKDGPQEQRMKKQESGPRPALSVPVPEVGVCVTRDSSLYQRQQTQGEDTGAVSHSGHFNTEVWESPFSWSCALMDTEVNGLHYNQVQIRGRSTAALNSGRYKSAPEMNNTGNNGDMSKTNQGSEKPFSCLTCRKTFTRKSSLNLHVRTHTGEKLFSCLTCQKTFTRKSSLVSHKMIHTGEKPFSCSTCKKTFVRKSAFKMHMKTHRHLFCKHILSQHVPLQ